MQTITVKVNNKGGMKALEALADKHVISIVESSDVDSPALPGSLIGLSEFKKWISEAEKTPTISLSNAKTQWAGRKKQLQKLMK